MENRRRRNNNIQSNDTEDSIATVPVKEDIDIGESTIHQDQSNSTQEDRTNYSSPVERANVILYFCPENERTKAIKICKDYTGWELEEAFNFVKEGGVLLENVDIYEANAASRQLQTIGCDVDVVDVVTSSSFEDDSIHVSVKSHKLSGTTKRRQMQYIPLHSSPNYLKDG